MRHKVAIAACALLVVAGGGAWWWYNMGPGAKTPGLTAAASPARPGAAPKPGGPPQAVGVEAVKVSIGTARQTVLAVGTFRSNESVMVRPELASRVIGFNFNEG